MQKHLQLKALSSSSSSSPSEASPRASINSPRVGSSIRERAAALLASSPRSAQSSPRDAEGFSSPRTSGASFFVVVDTSELEGGQSASVRLKLPPGATVDQLKSRLWKEARVPGARSRYSLEICDVPGAKLSVDFLKLSRAHPSLKDHVVPGGTVHLVLHDLQALTSPGRHRKVSSSSVVNSPKPGRTAATRIERPRRWSFKNKAPLALDVSSLPSSPGREAQRAETLTLSAREELMRSPRIAEPVTASVYSVGQRVYAESSVDQEWKPARVESVSGRSVVVLFDGSGLCQPCDADTQVSVAVDMKRKELEEARRRVEKEQEEQRVAAEEAERARLQEAERVKMAAIARKKREVEAKRKALEALEREYARQEALIRKRESASLPQAAPTIVAPPVETPVSPKNSSSQLKAIREMGESSQEDSPLKVEGGPTLRTRRGSRKKRKDSVRRGASQDDSLVALEAVGEFELSSHLKVEGGATLRGTRTSGSVPTSDGEDEGEERVGEFELTTPTKAVKQQGRISKFFSPALGRKKASLSQRLTSGHRRRHSMADKKLRASPGKVSAPFLQLPGQHNVEKRGRDIVFVSHEASRCHPAEGASEMLACGDTFRPEALYEYAEGARAGDRESTRIVFPHRVLPRIDVLSPACVHYRAMDDSMGPIVVSLDMDVGRCYLACHLGPFEVPMDENARQQLAKKRNVGSLLKTMLQDVFPVASNTTLHASKGAGFPKDLQAFYTSCTARHIKVGVLYVKPGQTDENAMFSNEHGSEAFEAFLGVLGEKVTLRGWERYRGGLDIKRDSTGTHSVFAEHTLETGLEGEEPHTMEIMYHVSTYLPYHAHDVQKLERKRHLGNDVVCVVFLDGPEASFKPESITTEFIHTFLVVRPSPCGTKYHVGVAHRHDVLQEAPPHLPAPRGEFESREHLSAFLRTKVINAEIAAFYAKSFAHKLQRTRRMQLQMLIETDVKR